MTCSRFEYVTITDTLCVLFFYTLLDGKKYQMFIVEPSAKERKNVSSLMYMFELESTII